MLLDINNSYTVAHSPMGTNGNDARRSGTAKYLQKAKQVLGSQMSGRNKISSFNTNIIPVTGYLAGIISCLLEEIDVTEVKMQKFNTMHVEASTWKSTTAFRTQVVNLCP